MSSMEPDIRAFLKRILASLSLGLVYLLVNFTAGIRFGLLFWEGHPGLGNYIFYAWLLASTYLFIRLLMRQWKERFPHG